MSIDEQHFGERVDEKVARQVAEAAREQKWERPSFAKGLYMGDFDWGLIHPHPQPDPQAAARGTAFMARLREAIKDLDTGAIERESRIPDEIIRALREVGAFGMKIPVEYGGLGLDLADYGRALMLVGTLNPSLGALLSAHQSIGVPEPVKMFGTEEQKRAFLPRCASGSISAFLLTENDVGSDPARLGTTATLSADGTSYTLNGAKLWTTNGVVAELLVVMAAVPPHELPDGSKSRGGISAFVVEADSPGIIVENRNAFMGLRGIENGVTRFHDVVVPVENRLGKEGAGLKIALSTLNTGRLSIPAMCAGAGKWSLKIAREWSNARIQWGKPVGEHEAVGKKIAYIAANTFALEAVFELSAALADAGMKDVRIEAALAKLFSSEVSYKIADELLQIRGGRGYETAASQQARGERSVPVEQLLRDLRINRIFEGSTEIMHLLIAREAVDAHLKAAGDLANKDADLPAKAKAAMGASGFYAKWLPTLAIGSGLLPNSYSEIGRLAKYLRFIERASRRLARHTFAGMATWQAGMESHQAFLGRVVDLGAELFAMAACISRVELMRTQDPANAASAELLALAFCEQSEHHCETLFRDLWANSDKTDRKLSKKVLAGDFTWLESGIIDSSEGTGEWIAPWSTETLPDRRRPYGS
ncbi:acyl-CoA dehydrogenase family protein [Paeniglutamicibacter psychrophenolicus]|uniref:Alkylation response protein AidB-like acyl-CoA dehydrogenase n=1 Tax=Paeniglutamicibacter psychrophenolicus TaxID=257454 RepID=A0ABS4WBR6_9MICC|nr:acyl-CoA dehydrogenase family protein [Paeniglutamicibacter psychrophenolicus]MBP2373649.1 alkylation response protein AidB-like acyl-CoA dehydrogenase [Paeniglutamicibacter psychrophenolicus]